MKKIKRIAVFAFITLSLFITSFSLYASVTYAQEDIIETDIDEVNEKGSKVVNVENKITDFFDVTLSGKCGAKGNEDMISWQLVPNGINEGEIIYTLKILGNGAMADYTWDGTSTNAPWWNERASINTLEISNDITHIGDFAFYRTNIEGTMPLPTNLLSLGIYAFACTNISTVDWNNYPFTEIPEGFLDMNGKIGNVQFKGELILPDTITTVGQAAFRGTEISGALMLKQTISQLKGSDCFANTKITSVSFSNPDCSIGGRAFRDCLELIEVKLPNNINGIASYLFSGCIKLQNISLPLNITSIGIQAFQNCKALSSINLPDKLSTIQTEAFINAGLKEIILPESLTTIQAQNAFACRNLDKVYIETNQLALDQINAAFRNVGLDSSNGTTMILSKNVTSIPSYLCSNWANANNIKTLVVEGVLENVGVSSVNSENLNTVYIQSSKCQEKIKKVADPYNNASHKLVYAITNGGNFTTDTVFKDNQLSSPVRVGYLFKGWYDNESFEGSKITNGIAGKTYYAKWEKSEYSIIDRIDFDTITYGSKVEQEFTVLLKNGTATVTSVSCSDDTIFTAEIATGDSAKVIVKSAINLPVNTYEERLTLKMNDGSIFYIPIKLNVKKAYPNFEIPISISAIYGQTLADITLPEGFTWNDHPDTPVGSEGTHNFMVTYIPKDKLNYEVINNIKVTLIVIGDEHQAIAPDTNDSSKRNTWILLTILSGCIAIITIKNKNSKI